MLVSNAVLIKNAGYKMPHGDVQLLFWSITRQFNDFHAIQKRCWHCLDPVGGGQKHHLGNIEWYVQVTFDTLIKE
jgi:hypothetical protein